MADRYGENTGQNHEEQGSQAETWHDDRPPVDDFADPEHAGEEGVTVSHESEPGMEDQEMPGRRKSMLMPLMAGAGGLVILGGLVWWQFGRAPQPPMMMPQPAVTASAQNKAPAPEATPSAPSTGGDTDIRSLYAGSKEPAGAAADTAPKTAMIPVPPPEAAPQPSPENAPPPAAASAPAAPVAPAAAPASAPATAPTTAMAPVPPPPPASTGVPTGTATPAETAKTEVPAKMSATEQTRVQTLEARLDEMEKSLDQATKQLNQVSNMVAATAPTAAGSNAVEDRLSKIEQGLQSLERGQAAALSARAAEQATANKSAQAVEKTVAAPAPEPEEAAPALQPVAEEAPPPAEHPAVKKAKARAKPKTSASHKTKTHAAKTAPVTHWVLRAATPQEAWVSEGEDSPQLRHVGIGDSLPGIGRVQSIRQVGDDWVVEGSSGTIH